MDRFLPFGFMLDAVRLVGVPLPLPRWGGLSSPPRMAGWNPASRSTAPQGKGVLGGAPSSFRRKRESIFSRQQ